MEAKERKDGFGMRPLSSEQPEKSMRFQRTEFGRRTGADDDTLYCDDGDDLLDGGDGNDELQLERMAA